MANHSPCSTRQALIGLQRNRHRRSLDGDTGTAMASAGGAEEGDTKTTATPHDCEQAPTLSPWQANGAAEPGSAMRNSCAAATSFKRLPTGLVYSQATVKPPRPP
jgi:hypothetical protein